MRTILAAVVVLAAGCVAPRSLVLGQMASPIGRGAGEVALSGGVGYAAQVDGTIAGSDVAGRPTTSQNVSRAFGLPAFEANAIVGVSDQVGFNVHASSAGLQPGIKWTVNKSKRANFAILPSIAFGYGSLAGDSYTAGSDGVQMQTASSGRTMFTMMAGLKLLVSHTGSGFYAGVGYDFLYTRSATLGPADALDSSLQHSVSLNIGININVGWLRIRPELAVAVQPSVTNHHVDAASSTSAYGGYGFAILPCFTFAAATPVNTRDTAAEEDEQNLQQRDDDEQPPARDDERDERDDRDDRRRSRDDDSRDDT